MKISNLHGPLEVNETVPGAEVSVHHVLGVEERQSVDDVGGQRELEVVGEVVLLVLEDVAKRSLGAVLTHHIPTM